jgi:integrase
MPRVGRPFFDADRNAWRLRHKITLPDGSLKTHHHLASGRHNLPQAIEEWKRIVGRLPDRRAVGNVAEAVVAWHERHPGEWHLHMLRPLVYWQGSLPLSDVGTDFLVDYRDWLRSADWRDVRGRLRRGYAAKTVRSQVSVAHRMFRWCAHPERGFMEHAPDLPELPRAARGHRQVPRGQLIAAFDTLPATKPAGALLRFILLTGCRPTEGRLLRWDQVDLDGSRCTLQPKEHKTGYATGDDRVLILVPEARDLVAAQPRTPRSTYVFVSRLKRPYTVAGLRSMLRRRGISGAYRLRHTWAQHALQRGVPLETIQVWLGHTTVKTTEIYAHVERQAAAEVAQTLVSPLQRRPGDRAPGAISGTLRARKKPRRTRRASRAG